MVGVNMNHFDAQAHAHTRIQNKMENSVHSGFTVLKLDNLIAFCIGVVPTQVYFFQKVTLYLISYPNLLLSNLLP